MSHRRSPVGIFLFILDIHHHIDSEAVSATLEAVSEEGVDDIKGEAGADNSRAHAEHVSVVVESGHLRRVGVGAERRADALVLIRAHRHTDARATDKNTKRAVEFTLHSLSDLACEDRVVTGFGGITAKVYTLVATIYKMLNYFLFK